MPIDETVALRDVRIISRIRKDFGDIAGLAASIRENGLIEPIVITKDYNVDAPEGPPFIKLVAGERRLRAMSLLGWVVLVHAVHYIWREELRSDDPKLQLLAGSIELEENLRRKDLTWTEVCEGKRRLLEIMVQIHGPATTAPGNTGFGVRKLAAMIGESPEQTSNDLELAALVQKIPSIAKEPSREAAKRKIDIVIKTLGSSGAPRVATQFVYKILVECKDELDQKTLIGEFRARGLKCQPIVA